jgi:hypothetical protein
MRVDVDDTDLSARITPLKHAASRSKCNLVAPAQHNWQLTRADEPLHDACKLMLRLLKLCSLAHDITGIGKHVRPMVPRHSRQCAPDLLRRVNRALATLVAPHSFVAAETQQHRAGRRRGLKRRDHLPHSPGVAAFAYVGASAPN